MKTIQFLCKRKNEKQKCLVSYEADLYKNIVRKKKLAHSNNTLIQLHPKFTKKITPFLDTKVALQVRVQQKKKLKKKHF